MAGAHRRLLLSRPPPRRTVRTLLEKQNWGVRRGGGAPSQSHPSLKVMEGPLQGGSPAWRYWWGRGCCSGDSLSSGPLGKEPDDKLNQPHRPLRPTAASMCPLSRRRETTGRSKGSTASSGSGVSWSQEHANRTALRTCPPLVSPCLSSSLCIFAHTSAGMGSSIPAKARHRLPSSETFWIHIPKTSWVLSPSSGLTWFSVYTWLSY